ncbi:MAG: hypothetical protein M1821_002752 [Bathelium mastoideum]|nr:MAG: hypothetical protein M1821_002752 [Bathelium mastoideum]
MDPPFKKLAKKAASHLRPSPRSPHSRKPTKATHTTAVIDAAVVPRASQVGHDSEHVAPGGQTVAAVQNRQGPGSDTLLNCWDKALQALKESNEPVYDDLQAIADHRKASPDDVAKAAEEKVHQLGGTPYSNAGNGTWYTSRVLLRTVSRGMSNMKDVVMPLSRLDPHGAASVALAIAFGGIYTLVQVIANENAEYMSCLSSIIELRPMIARWVHYERHFLVHKEPKVPVGRYDDLKNALVDLYQAILTFLAAMTRYCAGSLIIIQRDPEWETAFRDQNATILRWLFAEDPQFAHKKILEKTKVHDRYKDAGQWVFGTDGYQDWNKTVQRDDSSNVYRTPMCLWLDGNIGTGKTTVMARIIQTAMEYPVANTTFAFFYFSKADSDADSLTSISCLRSLVRQLSWGPETRDLADPARAWYLKLKDARKESSLLEEECLQLLDELVRGRHCQIFIDALDECSESDKLLVALRRLHDRINKTSRTQLQLLISSRPYVNVEQHFRSLPEYKAVTVRLPIAEHQPESDMETFVVTELKKKQEDFAYLTLFQSLPLIDRLIRLLLKGAGTMFRWVELQIELFTNRRLSSRESIREKLDRLEAWVTQSGLSDLDKLTEAYQEVYDIPRDATSKWRATLVYNLLLCARDDLSMENIVEAVRSVTRPEDADEINPEKIREICSCFLTGNDIVRFAHASAREFLERLKDKNSALVLASEQQHITATFLCLSTIKQNRSKLEARAESGIQFPTTRPYNGFLWYSCFHWPFHCENVSSLGRNSLHTQGFDSITKSMFDFITSLSFIGWQNVTSVFSYGSLAVDRLIYVLPVQPDKAMFRSVPYSEDSCPIRDRNPPGLLIAEFNFYEVMDEVIDVLDSVSPDRKLVIPDDKNEVGQSMLDLACSCGSYETLKRLQLRFPKDFEKLCERGASLHQAIKARSAETVSLLLENGADVFSYDGNPKRTTLHRAAFVGSAALAEVLLQHTRENWDEEKVQELLLARNSSGGSALYIAISRGHVSVMEPLLKYTSSTNILRQLLHGQCRAGSALNAYADCLDMWPTYSKHSAALHILLKYANQLPEKAQQELTMAITDDGQTALHLMTEAQKVDHVEALLEYARCASKATWLKLLSSRDENGETALHLAAPRAVSLVELLMKHARECSIPDFPARYLRLEAADGQTARDIAASYGNKDKVATLDRYLESNPDPVGVSESEWDIASEDKDSSSIDIAASYSNQDEMGALYRFLEDKSDPAGFSESESDITSEDKDSSSIEDNPEAEEWYKSWKREQQRWKTTAAELYECKKQRQDASSFDDYLIDL